MDKKKKNHGRSRRGSDHSCRRSIFPLQGRAQKAVREAPEAWEVPME